jgi:glycosyltransferase involved in cell wall biosynthesis
MRTLHVLHTLDHGGMQMYLLQQIRIMVACGLHPTVLCFSSPALENDFRSAGADVRCLGLDPFPMEVGERYVNQIREVVTDVDPDIIETKIVFCDMQVRAAAMQGGLPPVIVSQHGFGDGWPKSFVEIEAQQQAFTEAYICVSAWNQEQLVKYGVERHKTIVVHNGVDVRMFSQNIVGDKVVGEACMEYDVAFVGRLEHSKDPDALSEILTKCMQTMNKELRVLIVGDGTKRDCVVRLSNLQITGFVPHQDVPSYLRRCRLLLLPSRYESCPNVVLEAAALGIPTVARKVGGIPELVLDGDTGFCCPNNSEMAARVLLLLGDDVLRRRLGCRAVKRVRSSFELSNQVKARMHVYGDVVRLHRA